MSESMRFPPVIRFAAAALALCSAQAFAAGGAASEAQLRYRQDMARCNSGQSNQDPATCRTEARSALADARRGGLSTPGADLLGNALLRCAAHQGPDRSACAARISGEGTVDGSVSGGGILRQSVIVVPGS